MKRNFFLIIGLIAILFPIKLNAQDKKVDRTPKISGFVQGFWQGNIDKDFTLKDNTFQARRVRMSVEGKLMENLSYKIQGDFIRNPFLVDAFVKYKFCDAFTVQVGQFKTPFSLESPINPVNLEIFDYGESVKGLVGYDDVCGVGGLGRDLGIMATGKLLKQNEDQDDDNKKYAIINYSIGVFNGNGPVTAIGGKPNSGKDNNNRKDFVGKLEIHPMMKDLTLSGSCYYGWYDDSNIHNGKRQRWSAGAQYSDGDILFRAEYLNGVTGINEEDANGNAIEQDMHSNGYYAVAGYNIKFGEEGKEQKLMPVIRYEHFAKDADVVNGGKNYYTVGINYWPLKSLNFKLDYSLVQPESGDHSHRIVGILSYKF